MRDNTQMGSVVGRMITINTTDIAPIATGLAAIAKGLVAKGLVASALTPAPNEGSPNDGASARTEPDTGAAEATGHPAAGAAVERAAPNKVAVDAGAEAAIVVEALVPNPAKVYENRNGEAAVPAGTEGAAAATPTSPKVTWVNNAPRRQKRKIESKVNGNNMGKCELEFVPRE
jgi:hypothetical protein